jgi:HD-like signal output (HDOD) protein
MEIACTGCQKSYDLPDNRLPYGKVVSFPCPVCKTKITLDLRKADEDESQTAEKIVFKPLEDTSEGALDKDDLKKKIVKRVDDLPPMPKVMIKAREIMADPNSSFKDIAKVIETDQAIAAKILKVANSAYYGLSGMVSSIHQASVVLGYRTLEQVITMVSSSSLLGKQLKGYGLRAGALWRHSLAVAVASKCICQKRAPSLENDAFAVGLIHDAGKLALDPYVVKKKNEIDEFLTKQNGSFLKAELHVLGFDHTEIAHELCKKWKLPEDHALAMRYHHSPASSKNNQLAHIVHTANFLAAQRGYGTGLQFDEANVAPESLSVLRLKTEDLEKIGAEVSTAVEEIAASLAVK